MGRESPERPDLDIADPVLFLDFVVTHTFCVPEDPASLLIDGLAGKWVIRNFSPARARLRRPAGVVPHSSSTHEEISQIPARPISLRIEADFGANHQPPTLREFIPRFLPPQWYVKVDNCLQRAAGTFHVF